MAVPIEGTCEHPHISADYRNVFYRKVGGQRSFISSVGGLFVIGWVSGLVGGFV